MNRICNNSGNYRDLKIEDTHITYETFCGGDFSNSRLINVVFKGCDFRGVRFKNIKLINVKFIDCLFSTKIVGGGVKLLPFFEEGIRVKYTVTRANNYNDNDDDVQGDFDVFWVTIDPSDISYYIETDATELIGYKKIIVQCEDGFLKYAIAKLNIPAYADRVVFLGDKCRASCAQVLEIFDLNGENHESGVSAYFYRTQVEYRVGHMVYADDFDEDYSAVCTNGIHFFLTMQEALNFYVY